MELKNVQEKYDFCLMIFKQGVKEYVPLYIEKNYCFNGKCDRAKEISNRAWKRMKRKPIQKI